MIDFFFFFDTFNLLVGISYPKSNSVAEAALLVPDVYKSFILHNYHH